MVALNQLSYPPHVGENGIWSQQVRPLDGTARPALFLDRDGVLVEEVHYLHRVEDVRLIKNAVDVIKVSNQLQIPVIVVTNQSGIGRGIYTWEDFAAVQNTMLSAFASQGAFVDAVYACPFHRAGKSPWNVVDHPDRKPGPGMLFRAAVKLQIRLNESWIVGDRADDIKAGKNAGLAGGLHVLSGHGDRDGERSAALEHGDNKFHVYTGDDIGSASVKLPLLIKI